MKKKMVLWMCGALMMAMVVGGCGTSAGQENNSSAETVQESVQVNAGDSIEDSKEQTKESNSESAENTKNEISEADIQKDEENVVCPLEDGVYTAKFDTDSSMFHVNEANNGKGVLTVENGKMTIHVSLVSKKIQNLYFGLAEDAQKEGAEVLQPTVDTVTYSDGLSDEVFGFDIPVPYLDEEFDVALIGGKGTWYDHKVSVSEAVKQEENAGEGAAAGQEETAKTEGIENTAQGEITEDGTFEATVVLGGGSGKAKVESPVMITVTEGKAYATLVWSSKNYDYMIVDGEKYLNEAAAGENSVFTIPVNEFGVEIPVIGDTIAMSTPHEIEYTLFFERME